MLLQLQLGSESCGAEMGSTFYSPLPLCFFLNGEKEVESSVDLQHSHVNKSRKRACCSDLAESGQLVQNQELNQLTVT